MNKKIKILVCYHKKDRLFKNDVLVPIHCGRAVAVEKSKDGIISNNDLKWLMANMIGDDTGENISNLNRDCNEWTAIYWAYKNYDKLGNPDYIGLMHYRRLFDFSNIIKTSKFAILNKFGLNSKYLNKIVDQYDIVYREGFKIFDKNCHNFDIYQLIAKLSENYHPLLFKYYNIFLKEQIFYCNNMFIMKKEDFFNMCDEVFPLMFDIINKPKEEKMDAFISWIKDNCSQEKYMQIMKIYKENNNWYPRYTSYLMEYISCFYFMYLKEKYGGKALSGSVALTEQIKIKNFFEHFFSILNEYKDNIKTHKVINIMGVKIKFKIS